MTCSLAVAACSARHSPQPVALSITLRVNPTAVRDALLQAQVMGLVRVVPRSGAYVRSLSYAPPVDALSGTIETALMQVDHNLFRLRDARRVLEVELAGRAAERRRLEDLPPLRRALEAMASLPEADRRGDYVEADIHFHTELARLAGNAVPLTSQQALLNLLRPHLTRLPWSPRRRARTDRSHAAIYTAPVDGGLGIGRSTSSKGPPGRETWTANIVFMMRTVFMLCVVAVGARASAEVAQ
ncbi:HTH-type transcriptional regulator LutR [Aquisphaera giovannonii]|uniref:HTH-type transcriptional regulator LutR n=1 Tax=Aquisphaera giovannonii TaxID=406548 RepID=A0A5B9W5H6_9BACT|nr:FCD domain-containing protein [Aquisphaera giovannonii]QEH35231.1 HTH-type transcriptional regulator LutR [Aquisphaera giovannonii]